jgi:hypothetical protein
VIVGNGVRLTSNPNRYMSAPLSYTEVRSNWNRRGALLNIFTAAGVRKTDGIPSGMRHPQVWLLPKVAGGLASRFNINGTADVAGNLAGGLAGTATLAGEGAISTADAVLLGYLTAAMTGQSDVVVSVAALGRILATLGGTAQFVGNITSVLNAIAELVGTSNVYADAVATLAAVAALQGSGQVGAYLAGAIAADVTLNGGGVITTAALNAITRAAVTLTGAGIISPATLTALGLAIAEVTGSGDFDGSPVAKGFMHADISLTASTELSPESVAASVKAKLLETQLDGYTIEDIIKLTSAVLLGKSSGGATHPVFRSIDDQADRVSGEVDGSGNRIESQLNP